MQTHFHQLENGLTLIGEHSTSARSLAAGFFVRTGARDETPEVSGVSHFLEHMMFKGTNKRSPEDVNREFDEMGARYNAFTSEEETVYYGNVLPQFQPRLLDLLADMMRPALRDEDFDMEKNVILEEIAMYQDRPQFVVFDRAREEYFGSHPLGKSILGSADSIRALSRGQMHEYFSRRYAANNLTLVLTGNYDWEAAKAQAQQCCSDWNTSDTGRDTSHYEGRSSVVVERPQTEKSGEDRAVEQVDKFNRAHIALMAPGFSAQDERRYAASLACEAIGSGDASRLYWALVHPGLVEAAQISHDAADGTGVYYGYLLADPERAARALEEFQKVVSQACREGLRDEEVERAKRRLASSSVLRDETPMGRLRPVGMNWLSRREQVVPQESLRRLLAVTPQDVNEVLRAMPFEKATVVALGPLDSLS
jgi:predicted Zn-dependent peptidase